MIPNGVPPPPPCRTTRDEILAELGLPPQSPAGRAHRPALAAEAGQGRHLGGRPASKVIRDDVHLLVLGDGPHRQRLERFRDQCADTRQGPFPRPPQRRAAASCRTSTSSGRPAPTRASPTRSWRRWRRRAGRGHRHPRHARPGGPRGHRLPHSHDRPRPSATTVNRAVAHEITRYTDRLLDDAGLARRLGAAARQRVSSEFSLERMIDRYAEFYRRVLSTS